MKAYKNRYLTGSLTALLSCLLLFSCSEDELFDRGCSPAGEYSDHISFGVSPDTGVQTRGAAGMGSGKGEVAGNFVLRAADAPDTLCTIKNQDEEIEMKDKEIVRLQAKIEIGRAHV